MESRTRLSREELADIVASVFQYNGKEVTDIGFFNSDGKPIDIYVDVVCGSPGLSVRVQPEERDPYGALHEMTKEALQVTFHKGGKA